jgi:hypothetical protein
MLIDLINDWFDIMNVYTPSNSFRPSKCPYGKQLEYQDELLSYVYRTILNMRCCGMQSLQIFQRGMLMSINSLRGLFASVQSIGVSFILTNKVNQDALENLFSQLRTRGGLHDHPAPLNTLSRLSLIILGRNPGAVQVGTNTSDIDGEEFVFAVAIRVAGLEKEDRTSSASNIISSGTDIDEEVMNVFSPTAARSTGAGGSREAMHPNDPHVEIRNDAIEYFAGWIAKKHKNTHPHLGSREVGATCHNYSLPSWVVHLSYGGLIIPSNAFKDKVMKMESLFQEIVGPLLPKRVKTVMHLTRHIKKGMEGDDVDEKIIKTFVKHRVAIRIKFLKSRGLLGKIKAQEKLKKICKLKKTVT